MLSGRASTGATGRVPRVLGASCARGRDHARAVPACARRQARARSSRCEFPHSGSCSTSGSSAAPTRGIARKPRVPQSQGMPLRRQPGPDRRPAGGCAGAALRTIEPEPLLPAIAAVAHGESLFAHLASDQLLAALSRAHAMRDPRGVGNSTPGPTPPDQDRRYFLRRATNSTGARPMVYSQETPAPAP